MVRRVCVLFALVLLTLTLAAPAFAATGDPIGSWTVGEGISPHGLAVDSAGNLYVPNKSNACIDVYSSAGTFVTSFGVGEIVSPDAVAIGPNDEIFVVDTGASSVLWYLNGYFLWDTFFGATFDFTNPVSGKTESGIAWDPQTDMVYVADSNGIHRFGGLSGQYIQTGLWTANLDHPAGLTITLGGDMFVVEPENGVIKKFNLSGVQTGGPWGAGQLGYPYQITTGAHGYLFVSDPVNGCVQYFDSSGALKGSFSTGLSQPYGVACAPNGDVYVADASTDSISYYSAADVAYTPPPAPVSTPASSSWSLVLLGLCSIAVASKLRLSHA